MICILFLIVYDIKKGRFADFEKVFQTEESLSLLNLLECLTCIVWLFRVLKQLCKDKEGRGTYEKAKITAIAVTHYLKSLVLNMLLAVDNTKPIFTWNSW